ncbi:outer membrane receptor protein involved in Fe transport [Pontibacter ummariensis]|uniref:Outer membrane receptor proteins, mostly Fe transport n=1 Tax=Pontibacter ummariensis TaxID=1610492 RepID=A0A239IS61_9BACT|nr:outer membrane beta-barrel family protein [Pontibacter ummariensis]PRY09671.1 outer membrane receptor protein involved in Fe transport [Pontibacter ummariensis]SNS96385.1 Outer membrane receptor proteins, mostly Fe transport [Pontibacter ummariensis]
MKKNLFLLSLLLLFCSSLSFAQNTGKLTGVLLDENAQAVGFANVAVLDAATAKVVTGAIADMDGKFLIQTPAKGKYLLQVSALGYVETQTAPFEVSGPAFSKDFGTLVVKADVKALAEVQIETMRPTVTTHPDKMVVSVEGTALASGSTAYEVLTKSPGVWVDQDGNIQLNGKTGVQVMINGKRSFLSGKDLQNLLQGMTAENLKDLEIITNPSSKFDAEGASGIININLKKPQDSGMNGSVYAGYQYNNLSTYTSGADLSLKNGKWNSFGSLDLASRMRYRDMEMHRVFSNEDGSKSKFDQTGYEEEERLQPSLRLGTDYEINDRHSIGVMSYLTFNESDNIFSTASYLRNPNAADDLYIDAANVAESSYRNGTFNLHYLGKLDTAGTTLSADLDYVHIQSENASEFRNSYLRLADSRAAVQELLISENPTGYDIYSAKVDFAKQLGKTTKLELGAKASHVKSDNELRFFETSDGRQVPDPNRSNHFIYKEDIYAAYANVSAKLGQHWTVQGGLRAEQTESRGRSLTKNQTTDRSYLDLFPSIFLRQKISDNYQIGYKYSRRINRPNYQMLNPFIFYLDPYTWAQGNPYLKPQYINSFEVTQTLKQTYNLVLGYAMTKDFIAEVPEQNPEDNTTVFQQQNVKDLKSATATLVAPVRLSNKWEISNNITAMYQEYTALANEELVVNDQFTVIGQTTHNIMLPKGFRLEVNGGYQGPAVYGMYSIKQQWWVDGGLKRSFMNDRLAMTLNVTDIFKSRVLDLDTNLNGNINAIKQYRGDRGVRFNLRYRFSKGSAFESKKRNVNLDELNRAGGN